ncbi:MAG: NAD(P)(+) transhydrogenase (Re/Si-specific) subunit beta [Paracoccaceae bacterium]
MEYGFTTAAYVVAAVLFILSLGGLSGQESAKRAVWYGIVGMALAVVATLIGPGGGNWVCRSSWWWPAAPSAGSSPSACR